MQNPGCPLQQQQPTNAQHTDSCELTYLHAVEVLPEAFLTICVEQFQVFCGELKRMPQHLPYQVSERAAHWQPPAAAYHGPGQPAGLEGITQPCMPRQGGH